MMPVMPGWGAMVVEAPDVAGQDSYRGGDVASRGLASITSLSPSRPQRVLTTCEPVSEKVTPLEDEKVTPLMGKMSDV